MKSFYLVSFILFGFSLISFLILHSRNKIPTNDENNFANEEEVMKKLYQKFSLVLKEKNEEIDFALSQQLLAEKYLLECEKSEKDNLDKVEAMKKEKFSLQMQIESLKSEKEEPSLLLNAEKNQVLEMQLQLQEKIQLFESKFETLKKQSEKLNQKESELILKENILNKQENTKLFNSNSPLYSIHMQKDPKRRVLTYAIYRVLYGEDFLFDSIISILDYVDKIFIFWDDKPWAGVKEAHYKSQLIPLPSKIDNVVELALNLSNQFPEKIIVQYDHVEANRNQITHLFNNRILPNYQKPNLLIFIEWDHVWREDQFEKAIDEFYKRDLTYSSSRQLECFRTPAYIAKSRDWRMGTVFWNMTFLEKLPVTGLHANLLNTEIFFLDAFMINMGLCMSPSIMFIKFLIAIAFSEKIGDNPPRMDWYEEKWLKFDLKTNNDGLEMAIGYEKDLPVAYEYNIYELPYSIKAKYINNALPYWTEFKNQKKKQQDTKENLIPTHILSKVNNPKAFENFQRYIELHKEILELEYLDKEMVEKSPRRKKYIILRNWEGAGFGNRLQAIVSCFLFALITDRALLIDWSKDSVKEHWNGEETVAMEPLAEFFSNPNFEWDYAPHKQHLETKVKLGLLSEATVSYRLEDEKHVFASFSGYQGWEEVFPCYDYNMYFPEDIVSIRADNYFAFIISLSPFYRDFVNDIFGSDIFGTISRFLFRPVPVIQKEIDNFKKQYFGKFTLGLHVRNIGGSKLNANQTNLLWQCAQNIRSPKEEGVVWFLSTDNEQTRISAKSLFKDKVVFYNVPISRADPNGLRAGIIDLFLLSECDDLIVSAASTFSRIAYGLARKLPMIVNTKNQCFRRTSFQPCFFKWNEKKSPCFTKQKEFGLPLWIQHELEIAEECPYL